MAASFPPVKMGQVAGSEIQHTFAGDVFPQFTHHGKSDYHCELCSPFLRWAKKNVHQEAIAFFKRDFSEKIMLEEAGRNPRAIFIPLNKMIKVHSREINGSLKATDNCIGVRGFTKRYARKGEVEDALEKAEYRQRSAQKQLQEMAKVKLAPSEIEGCLFDSCIAGDDQKLVIDLVRFFQSGTANKNPVQILVCETLSQNLGRITTIITQH
ncbi:unnamed protein product [Porites evermanni]|uniref:Uncharacterized protein n=1 Tax=Porites evermanni TaxID=104178 RepID=A0ABN8M0U3_9CNID|nr:unnamed protein product [Porites evermanni]